jgi:hypothetical protein
VGLTKSKHRWDDLDDSNFPDTDPMDSDDDEEDISAAEMHCNNNCYAMETIVVMAMGLKTEDEDMLLVDMTKDPWLTKVHKMTWRLGLVDMKEGILCWVGNGKKPNSNIGFKKML